MWESTLVGVREKEEAWFWLLRVLLWEFGEIKRLFVIRSKYQIHAKYLDAMLGRFVFFEGKQWTGWRVPTSSALKQVLFQILALHLCEDYTLRNVLSIFFKIRKLQWKRFAQTIIDSLFERYYRSMKQVQFQM